MSAGCAATVRRPTGASFGGLPWGFSNARPGAERGSRSSDRNARGTTSPVKKYDSIVELKMRWPWGPKTSRLYPDPLRRVVYYDAEHDRRFVFLTNNFTPPA